MECSKTINRIFIIIIIENGIKTFIMAKKPLLTRSHIKKRLNIAKQDIEYSEEI